MDLRLLKGGAYFSDLNKIRDAVRTNGTNVNCQHINVIHPNGVQVTLHMNMAYQANSAVPPAASSLYVVGFTNTAGQQFALNLLPFPCPAFQAASLALHQDGSYASLGYAHGFPNLSDATLFNSVAVVANVANVASFRLVQRNALAILIITVSEAVRFGSVASGMNSILGNLGHYLPDWNMIHNWGGHSLGSN